MNILMLNTMLEFGGSQKTMFNLAERLQGRGHNVVIVTMYSNDYYISYYRKHYQVDIKNLNMKDSEDGEVKFVNMLKGTKVLCAYLKKNKIDTIQTFGLYANLLGILVASVSSVKARVSSQRNSPVHFSMIYRLLDRFIANSFLTSKMVAVSDGTRDYCIKEQKISPDKIITISNGIDLAKWYDKPENSILTNLRTELDVGDANLVITTIARLHSQKNHLSYINVIKSLVSDYPGLIFLFVGDGPLHNEIERKIHELQLEKHIRLLGARSDIKEILSVSDIFVLPSLWEGMPNSVIEAMCIGLPVIVSDVDGCAEVVSSPDLGILFDPENTDELSCSIKTLIDSPDRRTILGNNARKHVNENFNQENVIDKFENLYNQFNPG